MRNFVFLLVNVVFMTVCGCTSGDSSAHARHSPADRLFHDVMQSYEKNMKPYNGGEATTVTFRTSLTCAEIDADGHALLTGWFFGSWKDERLSWNPDDYDGVQDLRVPMNHLWLPDIVPYNSLRTTIATMTRAIVSSDGRVMAVPPMTMTFAPKLTSDGNFYVTVTIGSWAYDGNDLNLEDTSSDFLILHNYEDACAYHLEQPQTRRTVLIYECCPEPYVSMVSSFLLVPSRSAVVPYDEQ